MEVNIAILTNAEDPKLEELSIIDVKKMMEFHNYKEV
jgi:hypothetical protein